MAFPAPTAGLHPCAGARRFRAAISGLLAMPLALAGWPAPVRAAPGQAVDPRDATVLIRVASSLRRGRGTGFVIGDGGWVVTAFHVVAASFGGERMVPEGTVLALSPWTGRWYEGQLRAWDAEADIALLRLETTGLPALAIDGLSETRATPPALSARWKELSLLLAGFPAELGSEAQAEQAAAAVAPMRLAQTGWRGRAVVVFLQPASPPAGDPPPAIQSGWSGGAVLRADTGAAIGVFHSLFRPDRDPETALPVASALFQLAPLLKAAGADGLAAGEFAAPRGPSVPRAADARERVARQIRCITLAAAGDWRRVEAELRDPVAADAGGADGRFMLGIARASEGDLEAAVAHFQAADRAHPGSVLIPLHLGLALQKKGDAAAAEKEFRRALERNPREPEAQIGLGAALAQQAHFAEAEQVLRAARDDSPNHPWARYQLGLAQLRQGRPAEAVRELRAAVELTGTRDAFLSMRLAYARALEADRKFGEAEREYRTVIRREETNAEAHFYLANLYSRLGRLGEARLQMERLRKLPLDAGLVASLKELEAKLDRTDGGG